MTGRRVGEAAALLLVDMAALGAAAAVALGIRLHLLPHFSAAFSSELPARMVFHVWWLMGVIVVVNARAGLYTRRLPFWREFEKLVVAASTGFLVILAIVSLGKLSNEVSRTFIVLAWLFSLVCFPSLRYVAKAALFKSGLWLAPLVLVGDERSTPRVAEAIAREPYLGYRVAARWPWGTETSEIAASMTETGAEVLVICGGELAGPELAERVGTLHRLAKVVMVLPDLPGLPALGVEADYFFNDQLLVLRIGNNLLSPWCRLAKRVFDLASAATGLIVAGPCLLLVGLAVKLDSPGPILFGHRRVGLGGREFTCLKFRTMAADAERRLAELLAGRPDLMDEWRRGFKLKDDPRITQLGRFLRRTSLDEAPQLLNVLAGTMSLVGPRPVVADELCRFGPYEPEYLSVRPGITGLWQVSGRSETDYDRRVQLEAWYVRNWTLWVDLAILIKTAGAVLSRRGAY